ncbi:hypothetical protein ACSBR2_001292 [Camellia fascicularis]
MAVNPPKGAIQTESKLSFKSKIAIETLIPPKRRIVKHMMFEWIVQVIASCFHSITTNHTCNNKKKKIFPA